MAVFTQTILEENLADMAASALAGNEPGIASMIYILLETMGYSQEMAIITMMNLYNTNILKLERKQRQVHHVNPVIYQTNEHKSIWRYEVVGSPLRELTDTQKVLLEALSKIQNKCQDNRLAHIAIAIAIIIQTFQSNQDMQLLDMMNIYNIDTLKPLRTEADSAERENWRVNP